MIYAIIGGLILALCFVCVHLGKSKQKGKTNEKIIKSVGKINIARNNPNVRARVRRKYQR